MSDPSIYILSLNMAIYCVTHENYLDNKQAILSSFILCGG